MRGASRPPRWRDIYCQSTLWLAVALRRNILFLSKFRRARVCILFDCLKSLHDGSWKAEAKETFLFVKFHTLYLLKLFKKNKQKKTLYKVYICVVFVRHHLKTKHTVATASTCTVHVCHWVLITAVKLLKTDFVSDTTVQNRSSHCSCCEVH